MHSNWKKSILFLVLHSFHCLDVRSRSKCMAMALFFCCSAGYACNSLTLMHIWESSFSIDIICFFLSPVPSNIHMEKKWPSIIIESFIFDLSEWEWFELFNFSPISILNLYKRCPEGWLSCVRACVHNILHIWGCCIFYQCYTDTLWSCTIINTSNTHKLHLIWESSKQRSELVKKKYDWYDEWIAFDVCYAHHINSQTANGHFEIELRKKKILKAVYPFGSSAFILLHINWDLSVIFEIHDDYDIMIWLISSSMRYRWLTVFKRRCNNSLIWI